MSMQSDTKIRVGVVYGGPSNEHEVSVNSGKQVLDNIDREQYEAIPLFIDKDETWHFNDDKLSLEEALERIEHDKIVVLFLALHGEFGEDGFLQAMLDHAGIRYTGSGAEASALAFNKEESAQRFISNGTTVPRKFVKPTAFPVVVKPVLGGSSVGVSIVKDKDALEDALNIEERGGVPMLIQEYLEGREFTCGVLDDEKGDPFALLPTEIIPNTATFFDYEAKYKPGASREVTPPELPAEQIRELQDLALKAHQLLGCSGMSRSDFILKGDTFYILETNTIPGLTKTSLLPQGAKAMGIEFPEMLDRIIKSALREA